MSDGEKIKTCLFCGCKPTRIHDRTVEDNGFYGITNVFCITPRCAMFNKYIKPDAWNYRPAHCRLVTRLKDIVEWSSGTDALIEKIARDALEAAGAEI